MKLRTGTIAVLCLCACLAPAGAAVGGAGQQKPPPVKQEKAWYNDILGTLENIFQTHDHRNDHKFVPHNHGTQKKVPGGEHHQMGPLIPGETVEHAKRYGHFTKEQLGQIEEELKKYAIGHHQEIDSMRKFRKTLPIDPAMWSPTDKKRFDMRYKANMNKIKELAKESRKVSAKWKIPPKGVGGREKTYVLDEKHLAQISEHLQLLATKGDWDETQRKHFHDDLAKYVDLETVVLKQVAADRAASAAAKSKEDQATAPPTAKGKKKNRPLTPEMKKARELRAQLENAVHRFRHEL